MDNRILISGAGIAGLTLAHWLARYGFRPTVVERAPGLRAGGNGVDLRGPAIQVAERMGVMEQARAAATDVVGMKFVDAADRGRARLRERGPGRVGIKPGAPRARRPPAPGHCSRATRPSTGPGRSPWPRSGGGPAERTSPRRGR
ncbi:FAD-dependent monooxygenase [Streptomyces sp. NPDC059447]|uniref:FAD-dependent monooxygenase n=1 Tax=Streptomyces sp. NPDC059447 TaxID=3346834 RepID=UPI0036A6BB85